MSEHSRLMACTAAGSLSATDNTAERSALFPSLLLHCFAVTSSFSHLFLSFVYHSVCFPVLFSFIPAFTLSLSLCLFSSFFLSFFQSFFPFLHPFSSFPSCLHLLFIYSSHVPSSFIHSFHVLLPSFFSFLLDSNLSLPHSIVYVFTVLNDTDEWKIHINIHNTDLVHANNSVVNKAGEYNDAQN